MREIPWAGLAALAAMFLIPFLPSWLFEGPRTVAHRPMRHVCAECGAPWTNGHACAPETIAEVRVVAPGVAAAEVVAPEVVAREPLRGELHRLTPARAALKRRPRRIA